MPTQSCIPWNAPGKSAYYSCQTNGISRVSPSEFEADWKIFEWERRVPAGTKAVKPPQRQRGRHSELFITAKLNKFEEAMFKNRETNISAK